MYVKMFLSFINFVQRTFNSFITTAGNTTGNICSAEPGNTEYCIVFIHNSNLEISFISLKMFIQAHALTSNSVT